MENSSKNKTYFLEDDVLLLSGSDALKHFVTGGNRVVMNYDSILGLANSDRRSNYRGAAIRFISELNNFMSGPLVEKVDKDCIKLKDGSSLHFYDSSKQELYKTSTHITRKPQNEISLRRQNILYALPEFLRYGPEVLERGVIDIQYNKGNANNIKTLNEIVDVNDKVVFNNQIVRVNNQIYYRVSQNLKSNDRKTHYYPANDSFGLRRIDLDNSNFWAENLKASGNFSPLNLEQRLTMMNLLDSDIDFSVVVGGSGTGKTMLSYVAAMNLILGNEKNRGLEGGAKSRIVLFKPNDILGSKDRDIGFLKGSKDEKMMPIMRSYEDVHRASGLSSKFTFYELMETFDRKGDSNKNKNKIGEFYLPTKDPCLEIDNLIWGRGRTFTNCVVIADEVQNYTPYEIKQLLERIGVGTKLILMGDVEQMDNEFLDENFNGLTYAVKIMTTEPHPRFSLNQLTQSFRADTARIMRSKRTPRL